VSQTQSGITLSPLNPTIIATGTQQFTAVAYDQFGNPLSPQPTMTWSVISGGGTINSSGLYTAPSAAGSATVQAAGGGFTKTTSVTIKVGAPTVAQPASAWPSPATGTTVNLSVLGAYAAGEERLTYTWVSTGTPPAPRHNSARSSAFNSGWGQFDRKAVSGFVTLRPGHPMLYSFHLNDAFQFQKNIRVVEEQMGSDLIAHRHPLWSSTAYWYALPAHPAESHSMKK